MQLKGDVIPNKLLSLLLDYHMWQSNFYYFDKIPQILYLIFKQLIYLAFSISETMELISTGYITGKKMVPWWKVYELKR